MNTHIALVYGGRSTEHEVSVKSAYGVATALQESNLTVMYIGIAKDGTWHLQDPTQLPGSVVIAPGDEVSMVPGNGFHHQGRKLDIDAVLPVTHGTEGEDGRLQGLCDLAHVPCVGCDAKSSMVGMHKALASQCFHGAGIPTVREVVLDAQDIRWIAQVDDSQPPVWVAGHERHSRICRAAMALREKLGHSVIVKPEAGGSSVGVSVLRDLDTHDISLAALQAAIEAAASVDEQVLVQQLIDPMREVECAILCTPDGDVIAAGPGMVVNPGSETSKFLTYDQKYGTAQPATMQVPAPIDPDIAQTIRDYAKTAMRSIGGTGYARVDFMLQGKTIYINEINTLPGMTGASHYPVLIKSQGISLAQMLQTVVQEAISRYAAKASIRHTL